MKKGLSDIELLGQIEVFRGRIVARILAEEAVRT